MTTHTGIARNSAAAIQFLDSCDAVLNYTEHTDEWLSFSYDPQVEVSSVPDHLVWFSIDAAPFDAQSVLSVPPEQQDVLNVTIEMLDNNNVWTDNLGVGREQFDSLDAAREAIQSLHDLDDESFHRDARIVDFEGGPSAKVHETFPYRIK